MDSSPQLLILCTCTCSEGQYGVVFLQCCGLRHDCCSFPIRQFVVVLLLLHHTTLPSAPPVLLFTHHHHHLLLFLAYYTTAQKSNSNCAESRVFRPRSATSSSRGSVQPQPRFPGDRALRCERACPPLLSDRSSDNYSPITDRFLSRLRHDLQ